jgi:DNA-binding protein HU-beta
MNKAKLAEVLAERTGFTKKQMENAVDTMVEIIEETLAKGEEVTLAGFGTFLAKFRSARMGVNPQKPEERISIHSVTIPKFRAGKRLKDRLKAQPTQTSQSPSDETPVA